MINRQRPEARVRLQKLSIPRFTIAPAALRAGNSDAEFEQFAMDPRGSHSGLARLISESIGGSQAAPPVFPVEAATPTPIRFEPGTMLSRQPDDIYDRHTAQTFFTVDWDRLRRS